MKIAVISDIHGNPLAFDKVLEDIESKGCDTILCLGDLMLAGYDPNGIVERFKKLEQEKKYKLEIIQGNTDLYLTHPIKDGFDKIFKVAPCMAYAFEDDLKIIKKENMEYVNQFPTHKELEFNGLKVFMCHGSPRAVDENIRPEIKPDELEEIVKDVDSDIIFVGHTHIPCGFQLNSGKTVVNVGSVGRPMTYEKESCYVVLTISDDKKYIVEHHFVPYDNKKAADCIRQRNLKECEILAKMIEG